MIQERYNLVSKDLYTFKFPFHASKMDNEKLSAFLLNTYFNYKFSADNNYNDIIINEHDNNVNWVEIYIKEKINSINSKLPLDPINRLAQINGHLESSYKRNHVNPYNYKMSPHYTSIYVVKGTGKLIIECPDYKQEDSYMLLNMKPGNIYVFNSDLNYFTDKNYDKNVNRQLLITNYERI